MLQSLKKHSLNSMNKLIRALKGLKLAFSHIERFDSSYFRSKRIAIVGPASSAFNTDKGKDIDGYDIVVRVNKSALTVDVGKSSKDIGIRTDILFHCFLENLYSGGGPLDFEMYRRQGIQYVINPRNEWTGLRNSYNFYKKYLSAQRTYVLPRGLYKRIASSLNGFRPTTGYSALYALLEAEFDELYITGFTFFKTAYGTGYRDEMKESAQARNFMNEVGLHNPDVELQEFKKLVKRHANKRVVLDRELSEILANY